MGPAHRGALTVPRDGYECSLHLIKGHRQSTCVFSLTGVQHISHLHSATNCTPPSRRHELKFGDDGKQLNVGGNLPSGSYQHKESWQPRGSDSRTESSSDVFHIHSLPPLCCLCVIPKCRGHRICFQFGRGLQNIFERKELMLWPLLAAPGRRKEKSAWTAHEPLFLFLFLPSQPQVA